MAPFPDREAGFFFGNLTLCTPAMVKYGIAIWIKRVSFLGMNTKFTANRAS